MAVLKLKPGDIALTEYFMNKDGMYIHFRRWIPSPKQQARAICILVHGLGEHCARYDQVATALNQIGVIVYGLDHQGHGRSEGDRLFVKVFDDYVQDVLLLTDIAKRENPSISKMIMMGHSMGGTIAIKTLFKAQHLFSLAVLSAPAVRVDTSQVNDATLALVRALANVLPRLPVDNLSLTTLCQSPMIVDLYMNDPLIYTGKIQARLGSELLNQCETIPKECAMIKLPYLLIHGAKDQITKMVGSEEFHQGTTSSDKTLTKLENGMHETLFETPKHVDVVVKWLASRL